jgi:hypothetical protein
MIQNSTIIKATSEQISCDLLGASAVLNLRNGSSYTLDRVGSRIWTLIGEPKSVKEIHEIISSEFEVDPEKCLEDLIEFLCDLCDEELITLSN